MGWEQGRAVIEDMLTKGTIERVPPSLEVARALVEVAERHLARPPPLPTATSCSPTTRCTARTAKR
jgi:hypothetical protein